MPPYAGVPQQPQMQMPPQGMGPPPPQQGGMPDPQRMRPQMGLHRQAMMANMLRHRPVGAVPPVGDVMAPMSGAPMDQNNAVM